MVVKCNRNEEEGNEEEEEDRRRGGGRARRRRVRGKERVKERSSIKVGDGTGLAGVRKNGYQVRMRKYEVREKTRRVELSQILS
jgi:hypothetical protein